MGELSQLPQLAEAEGPPLDGSAQCLREMFAKAARQYSSNFAVRSLYQRGALGIEVNPGHESLDLTYEQLDKESDRVAAYFFGLGISKGQRCAAFLHNSVEWALLFWACVKLGVVFVSLDSSSIKRAALRRHFLQVTTPAVLVVADESAAEILEQHEPVIMQTVIAKTATELSKKLPNGWRSLRVDMLDPDQIGSAVKLIRDIHINHGDMVYMLFTSGTSGLPKACQYTNINVWATCISGKLFRSITSRDALAQHLPPSHLFACFDFILHWTAGATLVYPSKAFDAGSTLDAIHQMQCTQMSGVPSMLLALLSHPSFTREKTQSLALILLGGTIIPPQALDISTDQSKLGASKAAVIFGMSEGAPVMGTNSGDLTRPLDGCLGFNLLAPGAKIRICDPKTRKILLRGEIGEVHFGGDMLISGYSYGDNASFYDNDSGHWIATGDQARMNAEGTIYVLGRYKDIIIRAGENLSPALIETCLNKTGVLAQVVGVKDEIAGEVPLCVFQPLRPGAYPIDQMKNLVMSELGADHIPTAYLTLKDLGLEAFPSTASGKVKKHELRKLVADHLHHGHSLPYHEISGGVSKPEGAASIKQHLRRILAGLIGQPEESIPLDTALSILADSINLLRFQASIKQQTGKMVATDDVIRARSIEALAQQLESSQDTPTETHQKTTHQGPPTPADMVHTQGNPSRALRTRSALEPLLAKLGMGWDDDVEDVFPMPDLSAHSFDQDRKMAFSVRVSYVARSVGSSRLRLAIEKTLQSWAMFRSIAVKFDGVPLFVTLRMSGKLSNASISEGSDVGTPQDLFEPQALRRNNINVHPRCGGPLARFVINIIKSTGTIGLTMQLHHSIFDAISLHAFGEDLQQNLVNSAPRELRTPYKLFADVYHQYSCSLPAQTAATYHVNRLRGISSLLRTCWPQQRCHGWCIGNDEGFQGDREYASSPLFDRRQIDNDDGYAGLIGVRRHIRLHDLAAIRNQHHISTPTIFKTACAVLNNHLSGQSEVLFANTQAGRQWPFLDLNVAKNLPNPISIAGNTLSVVMNRIHIHANETTGSLLTHLEDEQHLLTAYAHVPNSLITSQLNPHDAAAYLYGGRQVLNCVPVQATKTEPELQLLEIEGYTDIMVEWHCRIAEVDRLATVLVQWDGCQLGKQEMEGYLESFMKALRWVASLDNIDRELNEIEW